MATLLSALPVGVPGLPMRTLFLTWSSSRVITSAEKFSVTASDTEGAAMKLQLGQTASLARGVARLTLNRPDTHNALNAKLIAELRQAADWLGRCAGLRAVVLTGAGPTFCAGGDLGWMQQNMKKTRTERVADSAELATMFRALNELPMPLIGRINGPAYGGGVGMVSVCDVSIAVDSGVYCLTEVRLGLLPANIAPYVVARMGEANARRSFLTARRMSAILRTSIFCPISDNAFCVLDVPWRRSLCCRK